MSRPSDLVMPDAATQALLITVLLYPGGWWPALVIASAIAAFMLLRGDAQRWLPAWWSMLLLLIVGFVRSWWLTDNHHLVVIAAVLLWVCTNAGDEREERAAGARLLIGVVFAAAVAAKVATGDFLGGTFGRVWPAYEYRLADIAIRLGAVGADQVAENLEIIDSLSTAPEPQETLDRFQSAPAWFALMFTVWTLAIEFAVAVGYLLGHRNRMLHLGHTALLIFCVTTYTIVPVQGFAAILLCLALASAFGSDRWEKVLTIGFACVILLPISAHLI